MFRKLFYVCASCSVVALAVGAAFRSTEITGVGAILCVIAGVSWVLKEGRCTSK